MKATRAAREAFGAEAAAFLRDFPSDFEGGGPPSRDINRRAPGERTDLWGCVWRGGASEAVGAVVRAPLADESAWKSYRFPAAGDLFNFSAATPRPHDSAKFRLGFAGWFWQRMFWLRGFEALMLDIAEGRDTVTHLRDGVFNVVRACLERVCACDVDGVWFFEDWGSQEALMISPAAWRTLFKASYGELFDRVHAAGKKVWFHSDGNVTAILDDLLDLGVDVLNVQLHLMDRPEVARRTRGRVCFLGGEDRDLLARDDPAAARAHARDLLRHFHSASGGYIAEIPLRLQATPRVARAMAEVVASPANRLTSNAP